MSWYHEHFIFENLKKAPQVIAKSQEKCISIKLGSIEFKDSAQFLKSPLDKLVKNLKNTRVKETCLPKTHFPILMLISKRSYGRNSD